MLKTDKNIFSYRIVILIILALFLAVLSFASGIGKEVVAQKGDGIYTLLRRHGLSPSDYLNSFIDINKSRLGQNNTLIAGRSYILPEETKTISTLENPAAIRTSTYDIFGEKYKEVAILSNELEGAVYYIVSGHGGPDPGAIGSYAGQQLCEDEYAYDVSLRLARNLIEKGATVYMITRDPNDGIRDDSYLPLDEDEYCYPNSTIPLNPTKRLRQRTDAVNNLYLQNKGKYQRMVAIHVDARNVGENIDVFFYHDKRSTSGEACAKILQNTLKEKYNEHQPSRGYQGTVSSRGLYVLKNTYPVAVYIELGNINHQRDQQRFIITDNRQAVSNWLAQGLVKDYQLNGL